MAALTLAAQTATAAPPDDVRRKMASDLADKGSEQFDQQRWELALESFRLAYRTLPSPVIALYEGRCLVKLGRLVEATEAYERAEIFKLPGNASTASRSAVVSAHEEAAVLRTRVPRLSVGARDMTQSQAKDVAVKIDGRPLDPALALALNDLGTELLFALARLAQDRLQAQAAARGLTMSGELRAGDPGLDLGAQPQVLRLAGASAIGIGTTSGAQLTPGMSGTSVHGLGIDLPPTTWSRCDGCPSAAQYRAATRRRANTAGDAQASMPLPDRAPA